MTVITPVNSALATIEGDPLAGIVRDCTMCQFESEADFVQCLEHEFINNLFELGIEGRVTSVVFGMSDLAWWIQQARLLVKLCTTTVVSDIALAGAMRQHYLMVVTTGQYDAVLESDSVNHDEAYVNSLDWTRIAHFVINTGALYPNAGTGELAERSENIFSEILGFEEEVLSLVDATDGARVMIEGTIGYLHDGLLGKKVPHINTLLQDDSWPHVAVRLVVREDEAASSVNLPSGTEVKVIGRLIGEPGQDTGYYATLRLMGMALTPLLGAFYEISYGRIINFHGLPLFCDQGGELWTLDDYGRLPVNTCVRVVGKFDEADRTHAVIGTVRVKEISFVDVLPKLEDLISGISAYRFFSREDSSDEQLESDQTESSTEETATRDTPTCACACGAPVSVPAAGHEAAGEAAAQSVLSSAERSEVATGAEAETVPDHSDNAGDPVGRSVDSNDAAGAPVDTGGVVLTEEMAPIGQVISVGAISVDIGRCMTISGILAPIEGSQLWQLTTDTGNIYLLENNQGDGTVFRSSRTVGDEISVIGYPTFGAEGIADAFIRVFFSSLSILRVEGGYDEATAWDMHRSGTYPPIPTAVPLEVLGREGDDDGGVTPIEGITELKGMLSVGIGGHSFTINTDPVPQEGGGDRSVTYMVDAGEANWEDIEIGKRILLRGRLITPMVLHATMVERLA